ncbi:phage tail spike protein [Fructilactobacillus sanfranciscensis]|uniref:phage tail spike protein n=1 Tax=Fructilactobacillus sanfranciscensis TaxID=1625 RepID=UPI0013D780DD|nr:phage tail spike protein [Fructilactobacillus sanfranciscensis]NDR97427.1 hypothetical protein [Fructilactobacillus sanfranciscensis]
MNLFLIDKNENVIGVVSDGNIIDLTQSIEINQADVLNGTITLDKSLRLDEVRYFAVPDRDNPHNLWMYRKTVVKVENDDIIIQGVNAFYDDLKAYGYIKDKRPNAINAEQAVRLIIGNTRWNVDFVDASLNSSNAEIHGINFYYLTYLDAIKSVEDTWTIEIQPFINIEGNKITRKYINLYQQMGGNKGKRFVYGENALQIVKESNDTDVYTALIGRGAGVAEQDDQGNDTGGFSRKITFADVEWSKAKGDPVDKPLGQEWVEWPQATKKFGYSDGTPRFGIVEFQNEEDPINLLKETWDNLRKSAIPSVQFSATVGNVGFLNLGETVAIVRYDLDIKYQTRVTKIDWNRKNEKASQITLGDKLVQSAADRYRSVQATAYKARAIADQATNQINFAINNGGTTIEWGSNEPAHPKEGDIWYDKSPDGTVVMKQYVNGQWIILIDDTTGEQIKNKVDKAEENVKQLKTDVDIAQGEFNKKLATNDDKLAHFSDELTVTDKKVDGLQGQITEVDNKATDIKNTADSAATIANDAMSSIQQAVANASSDAAKIRSDVAKVQDEINTVKTANPASVEALKSDITIAKKDLAGVHDRLDQARAAVEQNQKLINDSVAKISNDIEQNRKDLAAAQQANADTVKKLDSYTNQAIEQGKAIKELQTDDDSTKLTIADIKGNVSQVQVSVTDLTANLKDANDNLATVKALADSLSATLTDHGKNIASLQATAKELSSTLGDASGRLSKVEQTAKEHTSTLSDIQGNLSQVKQTTDGLVTTLKDAQGNIDQLQQTAKGTTEQLSNVQGDITALQKDVSGIKLTITDHEKNIHTLQADSKTLKDDMTDAQGNISSLQKTATSLDSEFKDHDGRISKVEQTASTLTNEFSDEQGHLNRVEQTANGTQQTVANLQGDVNNIQVTAKGLDTRLTTQGNDIATIKANASNFSTRLSGVEKSGSELANRFNSLQVGGRNLAKNTGDPFIMGYGIPNTVWKDGYAYLKLPTTTYNEILPQGDNQFYLSLEKGETYTQTIWVETDANVKDLNALQFTWFTSNVGHDLQPARVNKIGDKLYKLYSTYTWPGKNDNNVRLFDVFQLNKVFDLTGSGSYLKFLHPKIERGNQSTDWTPNPDDITDKVTANSTQIDQNKQAIVLKANQDTVNNLTGEVNDAKAQLKVQAGQISSKVSSEAFKMLDNKVGGAIAQIDKNATAIDQTDKKISLKADQTEVDKVKSTASQLQSSLSEQAGQIQTKVTSSQVTGMLTGYATQDYTQSLVTQKANEWNLNLTNLKTDVNAIKTTGGGVNLLTGTGTASGDVAGGGGIFVQGAFNGYDAVKTNNAWNERYINLHQSLGITNAKAGDWYTISVYVKADKQIDTGNLGVYRALGNVDANTNDGHLDGILMQDKPITTQWQQYSWSFQINNISLQRQNTRIEYNSDTGDNWIYWAGWVLEKGTVAHDWSPAPSDMATVTSVTNLSATVDGIKSTVANKADQSTVTQLSNAIQNKVSNADYQSKITELANGINSSVKKIDDITSNGGGRNLWLNSKSFSNTNINEPKVDWNTGSDGIATAHITGTGGFYGAWKNIYSNNTDPFTIGDSETFSVEMKGTGTITIARENDFGKPIVLNGNDWVRYSVSGTVKNINRAHIMYNNSGKDCDVYVRLPMVEKGTVAHDWSPAPEDLATSSQVTQLSDSIQTKVSNADYQSKITELAGAIQSKVSSSDFNNLSKTVELQTLDSADINNMRTNGHYFVHNLANNPIGGWVYVDVVGNGNDRIRQDVYQDIGNQHCYRRWNDSWWTDWSKGATESEITQLSDSIQTKVSNSDYQSKITQLANGIQSKVSSSDFNNLSKTVELQTLDSADINNMRTNGHYFVHNLANNPIFGWVYVDVVGNGNDRIRQDVYQDIGNQHCYRRWNDSWWTDWSKGATETQISQLATNINLRVLKNKIINQINISPEGILIDGSKTHITGKTVIDNAAIRDAAISNLSASKLTAGVIDCRKIDVMNISGYQIMANQITADKMAANAIMVGLNNSLTNLSINPYGFRINENGRNVLTFNKTGMRVSDPENNEEVGWIHANHMDDAHWFNGLALDVDDAGDYVALGSRNSSTHFYDVKFTYYKNKYHSHAADTLVSSVPFEFQNGNLMHGGATLEFKNSWLEGKWNLPTLGRGPSYIMFGDTDVFVIINKTRYSMNDVIHSIGRGKTWP